MKNLGFLILDVFAEKKFAGNQLAVFLGGSGLKRGDMQAIAKEMNYSETTFIMSARKSRGGYDVRIFTPETEVPFAGHPTLGTAFAIQQEIERKPVDEVWLNLGVGQIPVSFTYSSGEPSVLWMTQKAPSFGPEIPAAEICRAAGINPGDIDQRYPVMEVSTGLPFIIVPLSNLGALKSASPESGLLKKTLGSSSTGGVLLFCPETRHPKNDLSVRVFADYYGVTEDPATGSGNGCLAAYLSRTGYMGGPDISARVEQGYEIGRPSLLRLKTETSGGGITVRVGGKVYLSARGRLV
ncbi:MAG: PhzF family phenazine biosynthesis protein [Spirochaetes bacterium]|jgi:trans-2,3-dihydro-3-hydroxyanthranilate isomerase|nr:PhzF family phenazine biosynthesis protein [Spirochaetota bacterium]